MERTGLAEQKYLLSLLGVAEELLALMPPGVQRKYGLIKGTLAVQLGSDVHLHADSAILASLTTGIQPQISSATRHSEATPDSRERAKRFNIPESPQQRPLSAGPAGGSGDVKAAVVRSLDSELEPAGFAECESGSGSSAAPATSHHGGALGLVPAALQDDHHDVAEHGNAVEQVQEGARDDSHGPAVRASMMRHHLRALRACISRVRASCAATDDAERGTVKPHSDARGSEVTPSDDGLEGGHRMEAEANCEAGGIPDFLRPQAERDVEATSVTELLMECSEALGTLQALYDEHFARCKARNAHAHSAILPNEGAVGGLPCGVPQSRRHEPEEGRRADASQETLALGFKAPTQDGHGVGQVEDRGAARSGELADGREGSGALSETRARAAQKDADAMLDAAAGRWGEVEAAARRRLETQVEEQQREIAELRAARAAACREEPLEQQMQAALAELLEKRQVLDIEWQEVEQERAAMREEAERQARKMMRDMEAHHRSLLLEKKAEQERAHAKMLVFAKAEVQQALDQALQRAAQAEQEVARLERRVRELDDTAGFDARNKARELEAENRQLRRTISSLSKASAAERETYQALQRDLEGYKDAISAISEESELNRRTKLARGLINTQPGGLPFLRAMSEDIASPAAGSRGSSRRSSLIGSPCGRRSRPGDGGSGTSATSEAEAEGGLSRPHHHPPDSRNSELASPLGEPTGGGDRRGGRKGGVSDLVARLRS